MTTILCEQVGAYYTESGEPSKKAQAVRPAAGHKAAEKRRIIYGNSRHSQKAMEQKNANT